jgi:hypothetical protein
MRWYGSDTISLALELGWCTAHGTGVVGTTNDTPKNTDFQVFRPVALERETAAVAETYEAII